MPRAYKRILWRVHNEGKLPLWSVPDHWLALFEGRLLHEHPGTQLHLSVWVRLVRIRLGGRDLPELNRVLLQHIIRREVRSV